MEFRIADTFTDSLAKLTGDEQKAVKTAAFDLQMNPAHPGLQSIPQTRKGERSAFLVAPRKSRRSTYRAPNRHERVAVLRQSSRQRLPLG
jgi:hypothetical protein